jgi:hypothetical protein
MQFTLAAVLGLAATVAALPPVGPSAGGVGNANGVGNKGNTNVKFPVPENMTVKQAQAKCGDQAQLSCCNKATYAGDTTDVNSGMLGGALSNLIGAGSGADGLGLFDQCSKLDLQSKLVNIVQSFDHLLTILQSPFLLPSPSRTWSTRSASRTLPAARTPPRPPTRTSLVSAFPALPSAPSSKCSTLFSGILREAMVATPALLGLAGARIRTSIDSRGWIAGASAIVLNS